MLHFRNYHHFQGEAILFGRLNQLMVGSLPIALSYCWGGGPLISTTFGPELVLRKRTYRSLMLVSIFTYLFFFLQVLMLTNETLILFFFDVEVEENIRKTRKRKRTILTSEDEPLWEEEDGF